MQILKQQWDVCDVLNLEYTLRARWWLFSTKGRAGLWTWFVLLKIVETWLCGAAWSMGMGMGVGLCNDDMRGWICCIILDW